MVRCKAVLAIVLLADHLPAAGGAAVLVGERALLPARPFAPHSTPSYFDAARAIRLPGDAGARFRLVRAMRRGRLRAVAFGTSITANFAGCFGAGCHHQLGLVDELKSATSISRNHHPEMPAHLVQAPGFERDLLEAVNRSFPSPDHSLLNLGISASEGDQELACLNTLAPDGETDLIFLEFAEITPDAPSILSKHRWLLEHLRAYKHPPLVILVLNFHWCVHLDICS